MMMMMMMVKAGTQNTWKDIIMPSRENQIQG
jgi:cytochrome c551/c552